MANTLVKDSANRIIEINPSLSYAEVGRLLGVSRQRVWQVVDGPGRNTRFCKVCGRRIKVKLDGVTQTAYRQRYCQVCWRAWRGIGEN